MQVRVVEHIAAAIAPVWAMVSDFGGLARWHFQLTRCEIVGVGPGAVRTTYFADWWLAERLDRIDSLRHEIAYTLIDSSRPEVVGSTACIGLVALDAEQTRLEWTAHLRAEDGAAPTQASNLAAYYKTRIGHLRTALNL